MRIMQDGNITADSYYIPMSAPVSGNFQDHYSLLGIEPSADAETIQAAYARLAEKYHPNNADDWRRAQICVCQPGV